MATYTFYRIDTRNPGELEDQKGFKPWVQIELNEIRKIMHNAFYGGKSSVTVPDLADVLKKAYEEKNDWKAIDVVREIKREKSKTTCHVSTDLTPACGGYSKGNIYKIEMPDLFLDGQANTTTGWSPLVRPKLVSDKNSIDESNILGFACGGNEVAFLTPIPWENISLYKSTG